ncbi:hypothetical protein [Tichowtungia aerotolerans]|uniref:Uncharacterized protein n=1 Tax=Tichowtungia aerotolerans TaxID=2697043 RepID=A0A6P1M8Q0_9BACT|nr:hypothetical protein [Tichowtungia aerotolerans]QHI70402.1 hypothetical protein GT409_13455 [Tichowtungia aerotolerans]
MSQIKNKPQKSSIGLLKGLVATSLLLLGLDRLFSPSPITVKDLEWHVYGSKCVVSFTAENKSEDPVRMLIEIIPCNIGSKHNPPLQKGYAKINTSLQPKEKRKYTETVRLTDFNVGHVDVIPRIKKQLLIKGRTRPPA